MRIEQRLHIAGEVDFRKLLSRGSAYDACPNDEEQ
jgi:hypothetical protein